MFQPDAMIYLNFNAWCANLSLSDKMDMIGGILKAAGPGEAENVLKTKKATVGYFIYLHLSKRGLWMHPRSLN